MTISTTISPPRSHALTTLALLVGFALPIAGWLAPGDGVTATVAREVVFWLMTATVVLYVTAIERRPLASIGLGRPTWRSLGFGVLGAVVVFGGMAGLYVFVLPHLAPAYGTKVAEVRSLPFALRLEVVLRAAVFEEVFYRGFMIERLTALFRSRRAAATLSWGAFTAAHVRYWGASSVLLAGFGGLVLTALYLWRRDLVANMIAHALSDAAALLA